MGADAMTAEMQEREDVTIHIEPQSPLTGSPKSSSLAQASQAQARSERAIRGKVLRQLVDQSKVTLTCAFADIHGYGKPEKKVKVPLHWVASLVSQEDEATRLKADEYEESASTQKQGCKEDRKLSSKKRYAAASSSVG